MITKCIIYICIRSENIFVNFNWDVRKINKLVHVSMTYKLQKDTDQTELSNISNEYFYLNIIKNIWKPKLEKILVYKLQINIVVL